MQPVDVDDDGACFPSPLFIARSGVVSVTDREKDGMKADICDKAPVLFADRRFAAMCPAVVIRLVEFIELITNIIYLFSGFHSLCFFDALNTTNNTYRPLI